MNFGALICIALHNMDINNTRHYLHWNVAAQKRQENTWKSCATHGNSIFHEFFKSLHTFASLAAYLYIQLIYIHFFFVAAKRCLYSFLFHIKKYFFSLACFAFDALLFCGKKRVFMFFACNFFAPTQPRQRVCKSKQMAVDGGCWRNSFCKQIKQAQPQQQQKHGQRVYTVAESKCRCSCRGARHGVRQQQQQQLTGGAVVSKQSTKHCARPSCCCCCWLYLFWLL